MNTRDWQAAFDRLLAIAPAIERAGGKPLSEEEVVAMVKDVRVRRRAQRNRVNTKVDLASLKHDVRDRLR